MKIKQIKILQSGMDQLTGMYCNIEFVDGVSVGMFSERDLRRINSLIPIKVSEFEVDIPDIETLIKNAQVAKLNEVKEDEKSSSEPEKETAEKEPESEPEAKKLVALYTREELEKIADKDGIAGLREVGDKHGIKGRSIAELISELLEVKVEEK